MKIYMVRFQDLNGVPKYKMMEAKNMKSALAKFEKEVKYKEIFECRLMK